MGHSWLAAAPEVFGGVCVTWPQEAHFPRLCSPCGSAGCLMMWPKPRIIWLSLTFSQWINSRVLIHVSLSDLCDEEEVSPPLLHQDTHCLAAVQSKSTQDRIQHKKQFIALPSHSQGNQTLFSSASILSQVEKCCLCHSDDAVAWEPAVC